MLLMIHTESKSSSSCARRWGTGKKFRSIQWELYLPVSLARGNPSPQIYSSVPCSQPGYHSRYTG